LAAPDEAKRLSDVVNEPLELGAHDEIADGPTRLVSGAILWPPLVLLVLPLLTEPWGSHVAARALSALWHTAPAAPAEARRLVNSWARSTDQHVVTVCGTDRVHTQP
jgi:hypothetical protein